MNFKLLIPFSYIIFSLLLGLVDYPKTALAQEPLFELPVQLIGFPVIILAVRLSTFVKKLAYSLNPQTYAARNRRSPGIEFSQTAVDLTQAERKIISELGPKACVLEEPCRLHATRKERTGDQPDWNNILRNYKVQSSGMKQWYLLSVFLGDVIRDASLCKQLAKRMECNRNDANTDFEAVTRD